MLSGPSLATAKRFWDSHAVGALVEQVEPMKPAARPAYFAEDEDFAPAHAHVPVEGLKNSEAA
jgi:hypothetical protein